MDISILINILKGRIMRKIAISLTTLFWMSVFAVGSASATGIGVGVAGHMINVDASGTETPYAGGETETSTTSASVSEESFIGSYYLELTMGEMNNWALGFETIPGSADVTDKTHTRTDTETSVTGTAAETSNSRDFKANAEVEDFKVIYGEIPLGSFYVRGGVSEITVNTKETASGDGASYGNETLSGTQWGVGFKGIIAEHVRFKVGYEVNDFSTLNLTSTNNAVTGEANTLTADLDTKSFKVAIGVQF